MNQPEQLSPDPVENQQLENDLLKLQLSAEFGGHFTHNAEHDISPELENAWLKHILEFERAHANCKTITIYEKLDKPVFLSAASIEDKDLKRETSRMMDLLVANNIILDMNDGPYPDRDIYQFITEELIYLEVEELKLPGIRTHFIYEEFHPNHRADIERQSLDFLECWIKREFKESYPPMSKYILSPDGKRFTEPELYKKLDTFFQSFLQFNNSEFAIHHIEFEEVQSDEYLSGLGFSEGRISYDAVLENGEKITYQGGFKIFFSRRYGWWNINCFVMPGFVWE